MNYLDSLFFTSEMRSSFLTKSYRWIHYIGKYLKEYDNHRPFCLPLSVSSRHGPSLHHFSSPPPRPLPSEVQPAVHSTVPEWGTWDLSCTSSQPIVEHNHWQQHMESNVTYITLMPDFHRRLHTFILSSKSPFWAELTKTWVSTVLTSPNWPAYEEYLFSFSMLLLLFADYCSRHLCLSFHNGEDSFYSYTESNTRHLVIDTHTSMSQYISLLSLPFFLYLRIFGIKHPH